MYILIIIYWPIYFTFRDHNVNYEPEKIKDLQFSLIFSWHSCYVSNKSKKKKEGIIKFTFLFILYTAPITKCIYEFILNFDDFSSQKIYLFVVEILN